MRVFTCFVTPAVLFIVGLLIRLYICLVVCSFAFAALPACDVVFLCAFARLSTFHFLVCLGVPFGADAHDPLFLFGDSRVWGSPWNAPLILRARGSYGVAGFHSSAGQVNRHHTRNDCHLPGVEE